MLPVSITEHQPYHLLPARANEVSLCSLKCEGATFLFASVPPFFIFSWKFSYIDSQFWVRWYRVAKYLVISIWHSLSKWSNFMGLSFRRKAHRRSFLQFIIQRKILTHGYFGQCIKWRYLTRETIIICIHQNIQIHSQWWYALQKRGIEQMLFKYKNSNKHSVLQKIC